MRGYFWERQDVVLPGVLERREHCSFVGSNLNDDKFFIIREKANSRNRNIFFAICTEEIIANAIYIGIYSIIKFGFHIQELFIV